MREAEIWRRRNEKLGEENEKKERETRWQRREREESKKEKNILFKEEGREKDIIYIYIYIYGFEQQWAVIFDSLLQLNWYFFFFF